MPSGSIAIGPDDVFVLHLDGDLWLHRGALGEVGQSASLLVDLVDPRVPAGEGPGPNTVDDVAGAVGGAVYFSDCCEPISGDLLAVTGENTEPMLLGVGYSPTLSSDHKRLATANGNLLVVTDLTTGAYEARSLGDGGASFNAWDLIWSADAATLVLLYFDDSGFGLMPFDAESPFIKGTPVPLGVSFDSSLAVSVQFAGRGPAGEIVVAVSDDTETLLRYFDPTTLSELPALQRTLPTTARSVRLAADGGGLLWIDGETLWYLPANGPARDLGGGFAAAWFAT